MALMIRLASVKVRCARLRRICHGRPQQRALHVKSILAALIPMHFHVPVVSMHDDRIVKLNDVLLTFAARHEEFRQPSEGQDL